MKKVAYSLLTVVVVIALGLVCFWNCFETRQFGIFKVLEDNTTIEMEGGVDTRAVDDFNKLLEQYPKVDTLNIKNCPGSLDDDANLKLSKKMHDKGIKTHLMDNGEIASGGVDLFLAGVERTRGSNTKIGVHAWSGDTGKASDYPVGAPEHLLYVNYYMSIGFTQKQAEDFYYFTVNSAGPEDVHWMTEDEIRKYNMVTK